MRRPTPLLACVIALTACERKAPPLPVEERVEPADTQPPIVAPSAPPSAKHVPPRPTVTDSFSTVLGPVTITPIHHATVALEFGDKTVVIDPSSQAPAGWLPKADLVLITDVHGDHFDREGIAAVREEGTVFVAPEAVKKELPEARALKNGEYIEVLGIGIRGVPMYNLKRGPEAGKLYHPKGRGNGYVLRFADKNIYFSGDTECTPEMKLMRNVDVAFVCMNLPHTMPVEEAVECVKAFKPKVVIPFHYRGSDTMAFKKALSTTPDIEVRLRNFYVGGESK